jgi:peptidylprolyl isomerase
MRNESLIVTIIVIIVLAGLVFFSKQNQGKKEIPIQDSTQQTTDSSDTLNGETVPSDILNDEPTDEEELNEDFKTYDSPPEMQIDTEKTYIAVLKTTEGDITLTLNADQTPVTVNNFIFLAREGFYDGVIFHRVIENFMIQSGDPTGTGAGGPGYTFDDEKFEGDYTRGTVAMANAGANTNGSQFFIMHKNKDLPKNYVIFGQVIEGMDVVDKIAIAEVERMDSGELSKPVNPVLINSVEIQEAEVINLIEE